MIFKYIKNIEGDFLVQILIYYPYFDGTSTSLIDTYYNLKRYGVDVECYIAVDTDNVKQNIEYIKTLKKSVPSDFVSRTIPLNQIYDKQFDNLIVSFGIFRFVERLPDKYNHLFILDAGRIAHDAILNGSKYINYVKQLCNTTVYGNKANDKLCQMENYKIWYHKFSQERFNHLKQLPLEQKTITTADREQKGHMKFNNLFSNEYCFSRYKKDEGIFRENIGKMIFEFSALGKKVLYKPTNKFCDDGLTEYLELFGIDDTKEQEIHITEEELFDKLGMKRDDVLLNDIKEVEQ